MCVCVCFVVISREFHIAKLLFHSFLFRHLDMLVTRHLQECQ